MHKIRCIAIDDEPLALQQLSSYCKKLPFLELIAECLSAYDALEILENEKVDLMFVDINMPDLNGMDFIKSLVQKPMLIFTTAYSEYALEGFKVNAFDYLLKPISLEDFMASANKARTQFELIKKAENFPENIETDSDYLFIKSEYKYVRIHLDDILYIEGMKEYIRIHLKNQKPVMTLLSLSSLETKLPVDRFMRVHRSFIINLQNFTSVERYRIQFDDKTLIPISDSYKEQFQAYLDKNILEK